jgi:hypothetical protein
MSPSRWRQVAGVAAIVVALAFGIPPLLGGNRYQHPYQVFDALGLDGCSRARTSCSTDDGVSRDRVAEILRVPKSRWNLSWDTSTGDVRSESWVLRLDHLTITHTVTRNTNLLNFARGGAAIWSTFEVRRRSE